ncbi:hypothetical protein AK973_2554 [Pseudomonas brassicacearum]|nr:hypothetical protein AK973_2554 [Pseudomonas brassicacearum]
MRWFRKFPYIDISEAQIQSVGLRGPKSSANPTRRTCD